MKKALALILLFVMLLPVQTFAGEYTFEVTTSLAGSSAERIFNIKKGAAALHGTVLPRGQVFSFNDLVGPRTKKTGYKYVPNGMGDMVFGGGMSQVATTLDLALKAFDPEINYLERHTYGDLFVDSYVPSGDDAVRVEYSGHRNYAFTNNIQSMRIEIWVAGQTLHCRLTGLGDTPYLEESEKQKPEDSYFARLKTFDPATGVGVFVSFEMLRGEEAVIQLMIDQGVSEEEAKEEVSYLSDTEFVEKRNELEPIYINLEQLNFLLLYHPNAEKAEGVEGIPSNFDDFKSIWNLDPHLLSDLNYYRVWTQNGKPRLIEQVYTP